MGGAARLEGQHPRTATADDRISVSPEATSVPASSGATSSASASGRSGPARSGPGSPPGTAPRS